MIFFQHRTAQLPCCYHNNTFLRIRQTIMGHYPTCSAEHTVSAERTLSARAFLTEWWTLKASSVCDLNFSPDRRYDSIRIRVNGRTRRSQNLWVCLQRLLNFTAGRCFCWMINQRTGAMGRSSTYSEEHSSDEERLRGARMKLKLCAEDSPSTNLHSSCRREAKIKVSCPVSPVSRHYRVITPAHTN